MRRGGSKAKGSSFERDCCCRLSLWVSHGKREDLFWRSAMSGGRATVAGRRGTNLASQAGDISSVSKAGHVLTSDFYVEVKHIKHIGLDGFVVKGTGPLAKYWKTACREANQYEKAPLLIIRQNRFPTLFICNQTVVTGLLHRVNHHIRCRAIVHRKPRSESCEIWLFDDVLSKPFAYAEPVRK